DLIALGAPRLVRGLFAEFLHDRPQDAHEIVLNNVRRAFGNLSQEQLVRMCFALGKKKSTYSEQRQNGINVDQALNMAAIIKTGQYQSEHSDLMAKKLLKHLKQQDPGMLYPGPDHPPMTLLQWGELYRVKRAYAQIDRNAQGRRSRHRRTI
ncbi:hypothetical protein BVRB_027770, partial [Beta vulgaris subsp. vulgaris]